MLETAVSGGGAGVIDAVCAGAAYIDARVADVGVDGGVGRRLEVALEVEVVAVVVRPYHDGLVTGMGVADGPVVVVAAAGHGEVGGGSLPGLAEHCADPVVSGQAGIELEVVERSEVRDVVVAEVVADGGELVLELYEIVRVHGHDGFLVGHPLETVVAVELDGYLLALVGALGGHDDDAVGASATVDGRGECILEDVDGLDLR